MILGFPVVVLPGKVHPFIRVTFDIEKKRRIVGRGDVFVAAFSDHEDGGRGRFGQIFGIDWAAFVRVFQKPGQIVAIKRFDRRGPTAPLCNPHERRQKVHQ